MDNLISNKHEAETTSATKQFAFLTAKHKYLLAIPTILFVIALTIAAYFVSENYKLKNELSNNNIQTPQGNSEIVVSPSTHEPTKSEQVNFETGVFQKEFVDIYPNSKEILKERSIRSISKFSEFGNPEKSGWVLDLARSDDENYSDRYLAYKGELTQLDEKVAIECGFGVLAAQIVDSTNNSTTISFGHGCASASSVSLINADTRKYIPLSDPSNLLKEKSIIQSGSVIGTKVQTNFSGILAVDLAGEPIAWGYAVFDAKTGELLKVLEYDSLPQAKREF